ncbi:MAG: transposase [Clostridia bacterium]|nr:transposase [Clostridia bacterium]
MPRSARRLSATDTYHVMLRGINRQQIFMDDEDYRRFVRTLSDCKQLSGFELYAWCLMPNHVHLLIHVRNEPLEKIIKRIGSRFVWWYNMKYERVGHLFQDRYRSEPVEEDAYFLTVLRYILQNPMKAGLEKVPGSWPWSSYAHYSGNEDFLTDTAFADGFFTDRAALLDYLCQQNTDRALDEHPRAVHLSDEKAAAVASELTHCKTPEAFRQLDKATQRDCVVRLRQAHLTIAQIARLTGIPSTTIFRFTKME